MESYDNNQSLFEESARVVRSGGIVIVPTETFYALAADPFQEGAVRRIFALKGRPFVKPLPLIAAARETVRQVVTEASPLAEALMDRFWPGSLTILLSPSVRVPKMLAGPDGKIGVRVPPRCPARDLAELCGGWLTATSANLSDEPNASVIDQIAPALRDAVDLVMDLGPSPGGEPSTVVEPLADGVRIIREGAISRRDLSTWIV